MNSIGMLDHIGERKQLSKNIHNEVSEQIEEIKILKQKYSTILECELSEETQGKIKDEINEKIRDLKTELHDLIDLIEEIK
jgi:hypothetical protein